MPKTKTILPRSIAEACRLNRHEALRKAEIEWIKSHPERYEGRLHMKQVIKNINYRYQLKR